MGKHLIQILKSREVPKQANLKPQIPKISNTKDKPLRRYFAHESYNLYSLTGLCNGDFMVS